MRIDYNQPRLRRWWTTVYQEAYDREWSDSESSWETSALTNIPFAPEQVMLAMSDYIELHPGDCDLRGFLWQVRRTPDLFEPNIVLARGKVAMLEVRDSALEALVYRLEDSINTDGYADVRGAEGRLEAMLDRMQR